MEGKYDSSLIGPAQVSAFRSSEEIKEDVEELIYLNDAIYPKDIEVTVEDGLVTLRGMVRDQVASDEAEMAARDVIGVTGVRNELVIRE
jgi:osmotically-inducible protein OsmY